MVAYRPGTAAQRRTQVTDSLIQQRAQIEAEIADMTLCDLLTTIAANYADLPAYSDREPGAAWQTLTWRDFRDTVLRLAAGLVRLGLKPGDRVALMLPNRMEHVLADQAVVHAGGVPVTFYATLAPDQIRYVADNCDVRMAVLDAASELARWEPLLPGLAGLRTVIVRDSAAAGEHLSWADFESLGEQASAGQEVAEVSRRV